MYAQVPIKDSSKLGEVKGIVRDSAYNFVLNGATVAVYKDADSSLVQFSIPNTFGEFSIKSLPLETTMRAIITHVGYKPFLQKFNISKLAMVYDFGQINLFRKSGDSSELLDEVKILAPMQMNGDTLEFNADAFILDSNATVEDLMRRLPGFTIWGDGDITYNGKTISSILVNGKPFLSGDFSVITQNLPKNSIDKVQLYQQKNDHNPLDSTMNANIKLKKEIDVGYFGKISGGIGTDKRFAADGMLGYFNKKMQISVVAATNNINKMAYDVNTLIKNNTFKGVGANIDYQPDFRIQGLNKPFAAGATFQYDFLPEVNYFNTNRLKANYFLNHNNSLVLQNTLTATVLGTDSILQQNSSSNSSNISTNQKMNGEYERNTRRFRLSLRSDYSINDNESYNESRSAQERTGLGLVSNSISTNENKNVNRTYNFNVNFNKQDADQYQKNKRFINSYTIRYDLNVKDNDGSGKRTTSFRSLTDPAANKDYSRFYEQGDALSVNNHIYLEYPNLKKIIFGNLRLADIQMRIASDLYLNNNEYRDKVLDLDTVSNKYRLNSYLTNNRQLDIVNVLPSLTISKTFMKQLSDRYFKYLSLSAAGKSQHYNFQHSATQPIQNLSYHYNEFIPGVSASYNNNQYGAFDASMNLSYSKTVTFPEIYQLAPLIDSSNVLYIPMGNLNLIPQKNHTIFLGYNYNSRKKNPLVWSINGSFGKVNRFITDSTFYDAVGRRTSFFINLDGRRFLNMQGSIRKSYQKGKNQTYQVGLNTYFSFNKNPNYINNLYNISKVNNSNSSLNLDYAFKDLFALKLEQGLSLYNSVQEGFNNNKLNSQTISTMLSGSLQFPKNLNWSTNITFNQARANKVEAINFAIWNANLTYRFLQGNRAEVKFSALDMLHQNKAILTSVSGNSQSFGYVNVLQQYFMITLSYFPRKFGR